MTNVLRTLCIAAALVLSAGSAFAQGTKAETAPGPAAPAGSDPVRAENRDERKKLDIQPDLRRVDSKLTDQAEAARVRHFEDLVWIFWRSSSERAVAGARLERVDCAAKDSFVRARSEGASKDARIARVLGRQADRRELQEHIALEMGLGISRLKFGQFDKSGVHTAKEGIDERFEREQQKRLDVKKENRDARNDKADLRGDPNEAREESQRVRLEERAQAKADAAADKAADKVDKKVDLAADKAADKADRAKDRADDRKDVRTDAKIDAASDKKSP